MLLGEIVQQAEFEKARSILMPCWRICGDEHLNRNQLIDPFGVSDELSNKIGACSRKCIARQFEVLELMMNTRQLREKETIQGLAPGTLTSELI